MEEEYYVRVRGRVAGPYSEERLLTMVRRGQLTRVHELSQDQVSWFPASKMANLFAARSTKGGDTAESPASNFRQVEPPDVPSSEGEGPKWYFSNDGVEHGPVSWTALKERVRQGEIRGHTLLWTEGMPDWRPGSTIPDLLDSLGTPPSNGARAHAPEYGTSGRLKRADEAFCSECGEKIKARAEICPKCGVRLQQPQYFAPNDRNRVTAALLALLLGGLGAHKFYLGEIGLGVLYLLLCWTFIPAIVAFVEFIVYLSMSDEAFQQKYG